MNKREKAKTKLRENQTALTYSKFKSIKDLVNGKIASEIKVYFEIIPSNYYHPLIDLLSHINDTNSINNYFCDSIRRNYICFKSLYQYVVKLKRFWDHHYF